MRSGKGRQPEIYMAYESSRVESSRGGTSWVEFSWRMETFPSVRSFYYLLYVCEWVMLCFNLKDFLFASTEFAEKKRIVELFCFLWVSTCLFS